VLALSLVVENNYRNGEVGEGEGEHLGYLLVSSQAHQHFYKRYHPPGQSASHTVVTDRDREQYDRVRSHGPTPTDRNNDISAVDRVRASPSSGDDSNTLAIRPHNVAPSRPAGLVSVRVDQQFSNGVSDVAARKGRDGHVASNDRNGDNSDFVNAGVESEREASDDYAQDDGDGDPMADAEEKDTVDRPTKWILIHYHKTGHDLVRLFADVFENHCNTSDFQNSTHTRWCGGYGREDAAPFLQRKNKVRSSSLA
jgi:hypothetical protein